MPPIKKQICIQPLPGNFLWNSSNPSSMGFLLLYTSLKKLGPCNIARLRHDEDHSLFCQKYFNQKASSPLPRQGDIFILLKNKRINPLIFEMNIFSCVLGGIYCLYFDVAQMGHEVQQHDQSQSHRRRPHGRGQLFVLQPVQRVHPGHWISWQGEIVVLAAISVHCCSQGWLLCPLLWGWVGYNVLHQLGNQREDQMLFT